MKIISIGVCVDNNDPKGLGRIRYLPQNMSLSDIVRSTKYTEWNWDDPFLATPFLPPHINVIPKLNQSIKIIHHNTDKETQETEYIAGPFASPHDFGTESYTTQQKNTTYGGIFLNELPDIRDKNGEYIDKRTNGAIANLSDTGIKGNYGADLIFTENGLVLSGGKFITKETTNRKLKLKVREFPSLSNKVSKLSLKKFPKKMKVVTENEPIQKIVVGTIKYIVEYSLDNLLTPKKLDIYLYKILDVYGSSFSTDTFKETTILDISNSEKFKLINTDETQTTPTSTIDLSFIYDNQFTDTNYPIKCAGAEIRNYLYTVHKKSLKDINNKFPNDDIHPFFFRPTDEFKTRSLSSKENENRLSFISSVEVSNVKNGNGLIFSRLSANVPVVEIPNEIKKLKPTGNNEEQTFGSLVSDYLFLLSTDNNKASDSKSIDFLGLDKYEYTQDDYLNKMLPNTYAIVRGEILIKLLKLMYEFLRGHVHNLNEPGLYLIDKENELLNMIKTMETDLINKSIRIN